MRSLSDHMASFGAHHRDRRNRAMHVVGVLLVMFALLVGLSVPRWEGLTPAMLLVVACGLNYLALDLRIGLVVLLPVLLLLWGADAVAGLPPLVVWGICAVAFIGGWVLQLLGHRFETRRPPLLGKLPQLFASPLFLLADAAFALGWRDELRKQVASRLRMGDFAGMGRR
jgi:uncharacterized membrane protein YGL010W